MPYTPEKTATITIYGERPEEEKPPEERPTLDWRILVLLLLLIIIVGRKR